MCPSVLLPFSLISLSFPLFLFYPNSCLFGNTNTPFCDFEEDSHTPSHMQLRVPYLTANKSFKKCSTTIKLGIAVRVFSYGESVGNQMGGRNPCSITRQRHTHFEMRKTFWIDWELHFILSKPFYSRQIKTHFRSSTRRWGPFHPLRESFYLSHSFHFGERNSFLAKYPRRGGNEHHTTWLIARYDSGDVSSNTPHITLSRVCLWPRPILVVSSSEVLKQWVQQIHLNGHEFHFI